MVNCKQAEKIKYAAGLQDPLMVFVVDFWSVKNYLEDTGLSLFD